MDKNTRLIQAKAVFKYWQHTPSTMLECAIATGILRANICRYVDDFRDAGTIFYLGKKTCSISKHKAGEYTTNPELIK